MGSFHRVIDIVLQRIHEATNDECVPSAEIMVATHNRHSVALVVDSMRRLGLPCTSGIYFGQLLGMADHVTMTLGQRGYKAYKYVPYGPVDKVMPYLIRRTQENSTFLGSPGVQEERRLLWSELKRRLSPRAFAAWDRQRCVCHIFGFAVLHRQGSRTVAHAYPAVLALSRF